MRPESVAAICQFVVKKRFNDPVITKHAKQGEVDKVLQRAIEIIDNGIFVPRRLSTMKWCYWITVTARDIESAQYVVSFIEAATVLDTTVQQVIDRLPLHAPLSK